MAFEEMIIMFVLVCAVFVGCTSAKDAESQNESSRSEECCVNALAKLGMNLETIREKSRAWVFVDVFKNSTPFHSVPSSQSLSLDSEGWVTSLSSGQHARAEILDTAGAANYFPIGSYNLYYDGSGTMSLKDKNGNAYPVTINVAGHIQFEIDASYNNKLTIDISSTSSSDYIKNIRVIMPGFENSYTTQIFHPSFLSSLQNFKVIRFLNWNRANNSTLTSWSQRTLTTSQTQNSTLGVAPEYVIELANRLKADIWINIPHLASDEYITELTKLIKADLNSDLRVIVEHSNELWGEFGQSTYVQQQGVALGLDSDPFTAGIRFHAQRSVAIFELFDLVFGRSKRIVRVLGAGHMNSASVSEVMNWQNAYQSADAVATAPYYAGRLGTIAFLEGTNGSYPYSKPIKDMNNTELLAAMDSESQLADAATQINASLISAKGLSYFTYEGGPALYFGDFPSYASDAAVTNLFQSTCRASEMQGSYLTNMQRWKASSGGGLYMAFSHTSSYDMDLGLWYGCWGALETQEQTSSPKWQALMDYLAL